MKERMGSLLTCSMQEMWERTVTRSLPARKKIIGLLMKGDWMKQNKNFNHVMRIHCNIIPLT